jgi:uncharacterized membrane protein YjgN (DUF898 family)
MVDRLHGFAVMCTSLNRENQMTDHSNTQPLGSPLGSASTSDPTFQFDGGAATYFGTAILATLITLVTLGIALPFALVLRQRWQAKHTTVYGRRLRFTGTGIGLFGQWIKWFFLILITLGIYSFWVVPRLTKWVIEHQEFEVPDPALGGARPFTFDGGAGSYVGVGILSLLLTVVTFGLATPWAAVMRLRWQTEHTLLGGRRLRFTGSGGGLFGQWIKWFFLTLVTLGIYSFWVTPRFVKWTVEHQSF